MQVTIDESFQVDAPIDEVWAMLSDPSRVVTCVPGAKITETVDERTYKGTVSMKVGPVVTNFKGDIEIETSDDATHELVLVGNGVDAKGKGSATMKLVGTLRARDGGGTAVSTSMEVSVVGRLAQFGSRMMEDVSKRLFAQFVDCFKENVQPAAPPAEATEDEAEETPASEAPPKAEAPPPASEPVKALPLFFQAIGDAIRRFFRRLFKRG